MWTPYTKWIPYTASEFDFDNYPELETKGNLFCSIADLVHAAITVGRKDWSDVLRHQRYSYLEIIYRSYMLLANLDYAGPRFRRSSAYDDLDPSEKSAISYFFGLVCAKLFTEQTLGVPWLLHLERYLVDYTLMTGKHPDLIGQNSSGNWIVVEAKGRSNNIRSADLEKAKQQTQSLESVNGKSPILRAVIAGSFPSGALEVNLEDPVFGEGEEQFTLRLTTSQFLQDYYKPFIDLLLAYDGGEAMHVLETPVLMVEIEELDMWVGLNEKLHYFLREYRERGYTTEMFRFLSYMPSRKEEYEQEQNPDVSYGRDGIVVQLGKSWQEKREVRGGYTARR
jgi:hypothetical protein